MREALEEAVGGTMEGAALDSAGSGSGKLFGTGPHFLGGAAGEREKEDALRGHAAVDEGGHAVDEGARFPGSGTRDYQEGRVAVGDGLLLARVGSCRRRNWDGFAGHVTKLGQWCDDEEGQPS